MGISVEWTNDDKTIMLWEIEGKWTWSDLRKAQEYDTQLMRSVTHRVDIIADIREGSILPSDPHHIAQFRRLLKNRPSHAGLIVLIGASHLVKALLKLHSRLYEGINIVVFAEDHEAAFNYLERRQKSSVVNYE